MLLGLQAVASGLRAHSTMMNVTANNISNINSSGYKSKSVTFTENIPSGVNVSSIRTKESLNESFTINNSGIYDQYGRKLFNELPDNIDIDNYGNILDNGSIIGKINIYDYSSQSIINERILFSSNVNIATESVNQILALRAFQANAKIVKTIDEMLGTIINIKA